MRIVAISAGTGWHVEDLAHAAALCGHELIACSWRNVAGAVAVPSTGAAGNAAIDTTAWAGETKLDAADAVLLRTMPAGSLEQIIFRMDVMHRLEALGVPVWNRPRAIETAVDKFLALSRIDAAGLPTPATIACQKLADARLAFERLGRDVIIKPIFGSEGFGMTRVSDADTADRVFATLERMNSVIYLQQFVPHGGADFRLFVLGEHVLASMRRTISGNRGQWRTNIARGGKGEPFAPEPAMQQLAIRAAGACDAAIAGVDIVIDPKRGPLVLEVNAVPGWRELARVTGVDVASEVLRFVAEKARTSRGR